MEFGSKAETGKEGLMQAEIYEADSLGSNMHE